MDIARFPRRARLLLLSVLIGAPWPVSLAADLAHTESMDTLRETMRRIDTLMFEGILTELDIDHERRRQVQAIATTAGQLAVAAAALANRDAGLLPDPDERRRFVDNAGHLGAAAATLETIAADGSISEVRAQIERVGHACAGCHADFRPAREH